MLCEYHLQLVCDLVYLAYFTADMSVYFCDCRQVQETGIARHVFDDKEGGFDEPDTAEAEGLTELSPHLHVHSI